MAAAEIADSQGLFEECKRKNGAKLKMVVKNGKTQTEPVFRETTEDELKVFTLKSERKKTHN